MAAPVGMANGAPLPPMAVNKYDVPAAINGGPVCCSNDACLQFKW
jgi:hypothetical protein